jgi:hypothetical protein
LITTGTICDIFENLGGYLILTQSTCTKNAFNPKKKTWQENFGRDSGRKKDVGRKFRKINL